MGVGELLVSSLQYGWIYGFIFEETRNVGGYGRFEKHRIDFVDREPAGRFGEGDGVIAVTAGDRFVSDGIDALFSDGLEDDSGNVGFSHSSVGSGDEQAHGQEVESAGGVVKTGADKFSFPLGVEGHDSRR